MNIILPKSDANKFVNEINEFALDIRAPHSSYYYEDLTSRGVYSWVHYSEYPPLTKEFVDEYLATKFPHLTVLHTIKEEQDSYFAYEQKVLVNAGDSTNTSVTQEIAWRNKVNETVNQFDFLLPFVLEFNPKDCNFARYTPTVMLTPYGIWYNQGKPHISAGPQILAFNKAAVLAYNQSQYNPAFLYEAQDHSGDYLTLPFALVYENKRGLGNTVQMCSNKFYPTQTISKQKTIFDLLAEPTIWKRIIFHLLWTPLAQLKIESEQVVIPLSLQVKMFSFQNQSAIRQEIESLENNKGEMRRNIDAYIKEITNYKVKESLLEEQIIVKHKELARRASSKNFERELKNLKTLPYIKDFEFKGGGICFYTEPIQIDSGPTLGGYEIKYSMVDKSLKIRNVDNPHESLAHPHIYQDGDICFGNYTDVFFRFETGEFYIGMQLLHEFLSSYNPEDEWGRRLIYWDAKFVFEDMKMRGLLHKLEGKWDSYYYDIYHEHMSSNNYCSSCELPLDECECDRCQYCQEFTDNCECWICYSCGELVEDGCGCERCASCQELIRDCGCERCENCEELTNTNYSPCCECERCPDDDSLLDEDDERCLTCQNTDCGHNMNEDPIPTQEEELPLHEAMEPDIYELLRTVLEGR
jgi:protocadherin alpha